MLWMSAIPGAVIAMLDREEPLSTVLNHWDEAMAYAALCCLACGFEHPVCAGSQALRVIIRFGLTILLTFHDAQQHLFDRLVRLTPEDASFMRLL